MPLSVRATYNTRLCCQPALAFGVPNYLRHRVLLGVVFSPSTISFYAPRLQRRSIQFTSRRSYLFRPVRPSIHCGLLTPIGKRFCPPYVFPLLISPLHLYEQIFPRPLRSFSTNAIKSLPQTTQMLGVRGSIRFPELFIGGTRFRVGCELGPL
jgi:hypothetical protein